MEEFSGDTWQFNTRWVLCPQDVVLVGENSPAATYLKTARVMNIEVNKTFSFQGNSSDHGLVKIFRIYFNKQKFYYKISINWKSFWFLIGSDYVNWFTCGPVNFRYHWKNCFLLIQLLVKDVSNWTVLLTIN